MLDFLNVTKALTDENRLRILMALRRRELCVCQVTAFLDLAPSTTSKHLSLLRQARLIEARRKGKWVYYRLPGTGESRTGDSPALDALELTLTHLSGLPVILRDEARIQAMLEREELLCAGMNAEEKESLHSPDIHLLEEASG